MTPLALVPRTDEKLSRSSASRRSATPTRCSSSAAPSCRGGWARRSASGDGVIGAMGRVDGRPVACFAQDPSYLGGSLGEAQADTICRVLEQAGRGTRAGRRLHRVRGRAPAGGRRGAGAATDASSARTPRLSGVVPQISVICGASAGGGSYAPALTDIVVMTKQASMFLTGPGVVREVTGERSTARRSAARRCTSETASASSSPTPISTRHGSCATCSTTCPRTRRRARTAGRPSIRRARCRRVPDEASQGLRRSPRPAHARRRRPRARAQRRAGRATSSPRTRASTGARSASSPTSRSSSAGALNSEAACKAARFVNSCDAFGLPLVVLVDTPGLPARHARRRRAASSATAPSSCTRSPRHRCRA